jgi:hypothetical protein
VTWATRPMEAWSGSIPLLERVPERNERELVVRVGLSVAGFRVTRRSIWRVTHNGCSLFSGYPAQRLGVKGRRFSGGEGCPPSHGALEGARLRRARRRSRRVGGLCGGMDARQTGGTNADGSTQPDETGSWRRDGGRVVEGAPRTGVKDDGREMVAHGPECECGVEMKSRRMHVSWRLPRRPRVTVFAWGLHFP